MAYSPLAGGFLTGKYMNNNLPENSRQKLFGEYYTRYSKPYAVWHYHNRNKEIAEYTNVMVAFIPENHISKGTESALKEVQKKDKKYVIIN